MTKFSLVALTTLAILIAFIPCCLAAGGEYGRATLLIVPGSFGSRLAWVAHVRIVLFVAVPEVVCHGLLDSSLGKLAYTSRSVVSLYTVYT